MKINIVGTTASGKSTFGRELAKVAGVQFLEMDAIFWGPNWTEPTNEEFFRKLEEALSSDSWILDGNYTRTTPIKWRNIDKVIWLDYSFFITIRRSLARALNRSFYKTELWPNTGNVETFGKLFSKDSIVWWCLKNYSKNKKKYAAVMRNPDYGHIEFIHLKSPKEAEEYIASQAPIKMRLD